MTDKVLSKIDELNQLAGLNIKLEYCSVWP